MNSRHRVNRPPKPTLTKFKTPEQAFTAIASAVAYLGWNIAAPDTGDPNAVVNGLVIGTDEYIDWVLPGKEEDADGETT